MTPDTKIILDKLQEIDGKFGQIDNRLEQIDNRFGQVDNRFDTLEKTLIKKFEDEVESLAIMTTNGFDRLEARINKLEKVPA